jgi:hypothetical protein
MLRSATYPDGSRMTLDIHSVVKALPDRLVGMESDNESGRARAIRAGMASYPILDDRSADEILGYDGDGFRADV